MAAPPVLAGAENVTVAEAVAEEFAIPNTAAAIPIVGAAGATGLMLIVTTKPIVVVVPSLTSIVIVSVVTLSVVGVYVIVLVTPDVTGAKHDGHKVAVAVLIV
jgi:hypothetical protein